MKPFVSLPAMRGSQGRSTYYVCTVSLGNLIKILPLPDGKQDAEYRAQRSLSEARAHSIADYIGFDDYTLPTITATTDIVFYTAVDNRFGYVHFYEGDKPLFCNDGQHRRRAVEIALKEHPERASDTTTLVIYEGSDLSVMQQRFADLNNAQPAARSIRLLYDLRVPNRARDAALREPFLGLVEMQMANASPHDNKIWTLAGLDKTPRIERQDFWVRLLRCWAEIGDIRRGVIKAHEVRKNRLWAHNVTLQACGLLVDRIEPEVLGNIDWTRGLSEWEGRAENGRKMLSARKNATLLANALLVKLGLPLPPQQQRVEDGFLRTRRVVVSVPSESPTVVATPAATTFSVIQPALRLDLGRYAELLGTGPFSYGDVPSFAGISGGRTSALMAALLDPRVTLCFENVGREDDRTLQFLLRLEDALRRPIVWLEWRPPARKGAPPSKFRFEVVSYATCVKRDQNNPAAGGVLFDGLLQALADYRATKGLGPIVPYHSMRICTSYLKHKVQEHYVASLGVTKSDDRIHYVGLRADEPRRLADLRLAETQTLSLLTPLADAQIDRAQVIGFWKQQPFDLELEHDYEGNCGACFLKDDAHLSRMLGMPQTDAAWWIDVQTRYPGFGGKSRHSYAQLLHELPTRLSVENDLRAGRIPQDDGRLSPRRFQLVVLNEQRHLKGELASFSCACESSLLVGSEDENDETEQARDDRVA